MAKASDVTRVLRRRRVFRRARKPGTTAVRKLTPHSCRRGKKRRRPQPTGRSSHTIRTGLDDAWFFLEHFRQCCSAALTAPQKQQSIWFFASFRLGNSVFKPAPSSKPRPKCEPHGLTKILAARRYIISVHALKTAVQPRIHTDGHGYHALDNVRLTLDLIPNASAPQPTHPIHLSAFNLPATVPSRSFVENQNKKPAVKHDGGREKRRHQT